MSSELEQRLEGLLVAAPEPDPGAREEALHRALRALEPSTPPRRSLRAAIVVFAAVVVLLAIAAGSLAAAGALHVSFGAKRNGRPTVAVLSLPKGANGIVAIVDGRLSVVTKGGFRLQGLPATAAALSPHALYIGAGIGRSLVAMAPNGRRAWSHPAGGTVATVAWAPDGLRIAYVVHAGHRLVLHVIWGNGTHDAVIDRNVRAVRPSWRADSLALAYVGGGGKAIVYDFGHTSRRVVETRASGEVRHVAFAPGGRFLAVATRTEVDLLGAGLNQVEDRGRIAGIGWTGHWFAVGHGGPHSVIWLTGNPQVGAIRPVGTIDALDAEGHGIAIAVSNADGTRLLAAVSGERVRTILRSLKHETVRDLQLG